MELMKDNDTLAQYLRRFLPSSSHRRDSSAATAAAAEEHAAATQKKKENKSKTENELNRFSSISKKRVWEITDDEEKKLACKMFVQRVKDKAENHQNFIGFLDLVTGYKKHKDIDRVNKEVCELFRQQPELHIEFSNFLVDAVETREREKEEKERLHSENLKRSAMPEKEVLEELHHSVKKEICNSSDTSEEKERVHSELPPWKRIRATATETVTSDAGLRPNIAPKREIRMTKPPRYGEETLQGPNIFSECSELNE